MIVKHIKLDNNEYYSDMIISVPSDTTDAVIKNTVIRYKNEFAHESPKQVRQKYAVISYSDTAMTVNVALIGCNSYALCVLVVKQETIKNQPIVDTNKQEKLNDTPTGEDNYQSLLFEIVKASLTECETKKYTVYKNHNYIAVADFDGKPKMVGYYNNEECHTLKRTRGLNTRDVHLLTTLNFGYATTEEYSKYDFEFDGYVE